MDGNCSVDLVDGRRVSAESSGVAAGSVSGALAPSDGSGSGARVHHEDMKGCESEDNQGMQDAWQLRPHIQGYIISPLEKYS